MMQVTSNVSIVNINWGNKMLVSVVAYKTEEQQKSKILEALAAENNRDDIKKGSDNIIAM